MGLDLEPELRDKVLQEVIRLGDRKKQIGQADLPFLIADVLNRPLSSRLRVVDYQIVSHSARLPKATVTVEFDGRTVEETATGDGGYDAFVKALRKILPLLGDMQ